MHIFISWFTRGTENEKRDFSSLELSHLVSPWHLVLSPALSRAFRARSLGIRIRMYLDDWLILADSSLKCKEVTNLVLEVATRLGFVSNLEKSKLTRSQSLVFLAMEFNTRSLSVHPSEAR